MNRFIVFSETRKGWICPQNEPIRVLSGKLRRREGDEALIEIGTGWLKQDRKLKAIFYIGPKRRRVRVERSKDARGKWAWWLVSMEKEDDVNQ